MSAQRARVLVVQERLPHYRVPFFERLRDELAGEGVELTLAHGRGDAQMARRADEGSLDWAQTVENRAVRAGRRQLVWQPVLREAARADLVVVEQASRLAVNYALLARQACGGPRVALWGHGANLQADTSRATRLAEAAKARYSRLPHWWFAYTEGSARRVQALGFPAERVTVVQNATDTGVIEATESERDPNRAIYVGSLVPGKRLDLVLATADMVAAQLPRFQLRIVGAGTEEAFVEREAAHRTYVDYIGPLFGDSLARELKASSVMFMPGAVGLAVVDAFAAGLPVVTATGPGHGPEFEYVEHGVNGFVVPPTPDRLAAALVEALAMSGPMRAAGCRATASEVTVAAMSGRFSHGLLRALELRTVEHRAVA
jgi:L-malate glycosyltransferase